jgi:carboxylate-amine ligase
VGVEEEFLLVDATTRRTTPRATTVLARAVKMPAPAPGVLFHAELAETQVEAATGVCVDLADLRHQLWEARALLAGAARAEDVRLVSTGHPVLAGSSVPLAPGEHFARIGEILAGAVAGYQACGCHVHVGVSDLETAVAVVNHLRPWLPTLLALSVNSPFRHGEDSGYASWRIMEQARFPGSGIPPWFPSAGAYTRRLDQLVDIGVLADTTTTFWLARPSPRLPTVEIRAADAASTVDEAVLHAALTRALVQTALAELSVGRQAPAVDDQICAAATWSAARHGLAGPGVHPLRQRRVAAAQLLEELLDRVSPALEEAGDLAETHAAVRRIMSGGTGTDRQRAEATHGLQSVVDMLVRQTET